MRIAQLQRPVAAAASCLARTNPTAALRQLPDAFAQLRIGASNAALEGRRYASVKAQGAYKIRSTRTIPKKMGAKKTGDNYVITGNIIYKQRGTLWFPGENCGMGRDHTIYALTSGYVKYYKDPLKHPKRQYIGVVFERDQKLPQPPHAVRRRRLNMTATVMSPAPPEPELSPSGIPTTVVRPGNGRAPHPRDERVLRLDRADGAYAYAEESWRLGTLVRTHKRPRGSRRVAMRHRRRRTKRREQRRRALRVERLERRRLTIDGLHAARGRRMREARQRRRAERMAGLEGGGAENINVNPDAGNAGTGGHSAANAAIPPTGGEMKPLKGAASGAEKRQVEKMKPQKAKKGGQAKKGQGKKS
ncbi:ribosomal L27 protein-domain-containing protein [Xylariaceae sp. FL0804]|nr:ribosomal L27 protein-domain-containing protein [Xylariaceae sp. FL0804]